MLTHEHIYCYSTQLSENKDINHYLKLFKTSVIHSSRFHNSVLILTDIEGYKLLKDFPCDVEINCPTNLKYKDDFKIYCLNKYPSKVIVDPDVIFFRQLIEKPEYDFFVDFNAKDHYLDRKTILQDRIDLWESKGFSKLYPNYFNPDLLPNLGLLRIPNLELAKKYTDIYNKIKNWALNNVDYNLVDSRLIGEFSLGYISKDYKAGFYRNFNNLYDHHAGDNKYNSDFKVKNDSSLL